MNFSAYHFQYSISRRYSFLPMGDDDACDAHRTNGGVDRLLMAGVEMGRAFIHNQNFGLAVKRTGKQHTLLLPARQR